VPAANAPVEAAALALVALLLVAPAQVQAAEDVNGFACPTNSVVTLNPGVDLAAAGYHNDNTTYILREGNYIISSAGMIANSAPLCYIGQGNVLVRVTAQAQAGPTQPYAFNPAAALGLKGLTLLGQRQPGVGAIFVTSGEPLYAEGVTIQEFTAPFGPLSMNFQRLNVPAAAYLKRVKFLSNEGLFGGAIVCDGSSSTGSTLMMDTVSQAGDHRAAAQAACFD